MTQAQPVRLLKLPDGPRSVAFLAWVHILQSDPVLAGAVGVNGEVVNWFCRTGQPEDEQEPSEGACPIVALSPVSRPDRNDSNRTRLITMEIAIETYIQGSSAVDQLNLWDAIQAAALLDRELPDGPTVAAYLRCKLPALDNGDAVSISDFEFGPPAISPYLPSSAASGAATGAMTVGRGSISFKFPARR